ncbi:MAG: hypothetical protein JNM30_08320 [Rhodospirillales bacterium]|nr:hypothetical protein [Rhodospirillales bacterium]
MLQGLIDRFWPSPVADAAALRRLLSGEASYLGQRSTYEFTRNTLAWFGQHHFADDRFNDHFRICRWETFASVLQAMVLLTAARLRPAAPGREAALAEGLAAVYADALAEYPLPTHRPEGWSDVVDLLRTRLALAEAPDPRLLANAATTRMIQVMPVLSSNRDDDFRTIESAIRFGLVAFADRLPRRLDAPALAAGLSGAMAKASVAD